LLTLDGKNGQPAWCRTKNRCPCGAAVEVESVPKSRVARFELDVAIARCCSMFHCVWGKGVPALVGESGSGKTSLARAIAGLGENVQGQSLRRRAFGVCRTRA
jgi:peptide/nickel transport system ATP-binding protein